MIFVTVGTHEQQFNRLLECIDNIKKDNLIDDEVIVQSGYSDYKPRYCKCKEFFSYNDMVDMVKKARIVITHGGPSSFMLALFHGKIPIVVPRQKKFNEHINDHQKDFANQVATRKKNIIVINDINDLANSVKNYNKIISDMKSEITSNNIEFNLALEKMVSKIM